MLRTLILSVGTLLACTPSASAIIAGHAADPARTPWFVTYDSCGGSLIAPDRVLTAAHCVAEAAPSKLGAVEVAGAPGQRPRVTGISIHPRFSLDRFAKLAANWPDYDVAVLRLERPVTGVVPVRIGRAQAGRALEIVGRGATARGGAPGVRGRPLRGATLRTLADAPCERFWRTYKGGKDRRTFEHEIMVCGVDPRHSPARRRSPCIGDSGGPAFTGAGRTARLVGVTSWAPDRCNDGPSVFTEVAAVRAFAERRDHPWAPAPIGAPILSGDRAAGSVLTCTPPAWAVAPQRLQVVFTVFSFPKGERVLQRRTSTTYAVQAGDRAEKIGCTVEASTAGGRVALRASEA